MSTAKSVSKKPNLGAARLRAHLPAVVYWGLLLLLIWTPLAFGAVHPLAAGLMNLHIFLLTALWMIGRLGGVGARGHRPSTAAPGRLITALGMSLCGFFVGFLVFQFLPLPPDVLKWLSPSIYHLYSQLIPNWPDVYAPLSLNAAATRASVVNLIAYVSLFFLVTDTIHTRHRFRLTVQVIVGIGFFIALLGMAQHFSGTHSIYWLRETSYSPHFFGPYINRNHGAGYLVMALLFGLGLIFTQKSRARVDRTAASVRNLFQAIEHWVGLRGLWVYVLAVIAGALCVSLSRGAILSLFAGAVLFVLLRRPSSPASRSWRKWGWLLAGMAAVGLWVGVEPLLNRLTVEQISGELSSFGRLGLWRATWEMAKAFPVWGIGLAAYSVVFPRYQTADLNGYFLQAHNDLLQLVAETGWVGASLFVGLLIVVASDIIRRWQRRHDPFIREMVPAGLAALAAMSLHALVDFNFHIPANALLFTVILALLYAGVRLPRRERRPVATDAGDGDTRGGNQTRLGRTALSISGMACALLLCYGATQVVVANLLYPQQRFVRPQHWTQQADLDLRRQRLQSALRWHPNQDTYWLSLADLEVETIRQLHAASPENRELLSAMIPRLGQADRWYERVLQQRPTDPYVHLGRLFGMRLRASLSPDSILSQELESEALDLTGSDLAGHDLADYAGRIATLAPTNPDLQYALGVLLFAREIESSRLAVGTQPHDFTSSPFFQRAIRLRPELAEVLLPLLLKALPKDEALARFVLAIPQTELGLHTAARLMEEQSWLQARSLYLAGLALAPIKAKAMKRYGDALHRHGAYAAAREIWRQLQAVTPRDDGVYLRLADVQSRLGDHAGALQTLRQLTAQFPDQPEYHNQLATAYLKADRPVEAQVEWRALSRRFPHFVDAYVGLAQAYEHQQDYAGSIALMRKAVNMAPGSIRSHSYLARLYQKLGSDDIALREYQRLESFHPDNPDVLYQIGAYAQQAGQFDRARAYYLRALRLNPDDMKFRQALGHLETQHLSHRQEMNHLP